MSTHPTQYLAEIAEGTAGGETAIIYADIRRLTGVPFVALIYRHLATIPHALEALWQAAGPLLESGELQECAWHVGRYAWTGPVPDLPADVRGLGEEQLARIADVLAAYNRANPVNFAIVSAIRAQPGSGRTARPVSRVAWTPPPEIRSLAPIPPVGELQSEVRKLVDAFGKRESAGKPVLVPTLYRHLAHWPAFLALVHREVQPRLGSGEFQPAIEEFRTAIQREAARFACDPSSTAAPVLRAAAPVFDRFSGVIPEMVVVGTFLSRTLAQH